MIGRLAAALLVLLAAGCMQPITTSHFDSEGISFDYPSTWNAATFFTPSSFRYPIAYLSTESMVDPCDRTSESFSCTRQVVSSLGPAGILVIWSADGFPTWMFDSNAGDPVSVGIMRGTIEVTPATSGCTEFGGTTAVSVIVPTGPGNFMHVWGCLADAYEGTIKAQFEAMLASTVWH